MAARRKVRLAPVFGTVIGASRMGNLAPNATITVADVAVQALAGNSATAKSWAGIAAKGIVTTPLRNAIAAGIPVAAGALVSVAADKLGVNKVLAKGRLPFRI